jgi:hypothetical protein
LVHDALKNFSLSATSASASTSSIGCPAEAPFHFWPDALRKRDIISMADVDAASVPLAGGLISIKKPAGGMAPEEIGRLSANSRSSSLVSKAVVFSHSQLIHGNSPESTMKNSI